MQIKAYTAPGCFYCDQLKELSRRAEVEYELVEVGREYTREEFQADYPNATGFPYVLIDGEKVGAVVEVAKLFLQKGLVSSKKNG